MNIGKLNSLSKNKLFEQLEKCCGSCAWVNAMIANHPFVTEVSLHKISDAIWENLSEQDYLEAFSHHPQIGDVASLKKKFASTAQWASKEQHGASEASDEILLKLKQGNDTYLKRFGFIFIVCATGKTAGQMLDLLNARLTNNRATEIKIAASEQNKITRLRLKKLVKP
ncbi:MAG: 2-oxo-4-hydroxy-4-carboxy-5-ureidoimidazoline decarboxylase [Proteobacteria bacterium]|nr:2-oxo-4-hydroxy-4-carboxy-5-ureidoimidazoline decarboxylase [Pseudomonadota bacterium]